MFIKMPRPSWLSLGLPGCVRILTCSVPQVQAVAQGLRISRVTARRVMGGRRRLRQRCCCFYFTWASPCFCLKSHRSADVCRVAGKYIGVNPRLVYAGSDRSVGLAGMPAYPPTPACLPAASPLTLRTMVVVGGCHQPPAAAALDLVPRDLLILVGVGPGP